MADLILPDHAPLESWLDDVPESGASQAVASLAPPAVQPAARHARHARRAAWSGAADLAATWPRRFPWKTFDAMLRAAFVPLRTTWRFDQREDRRRFLGARRRTQGGWWSVPARGHSAAHRLRWQRPSTRRWQWPQPEFDGDAGDFPFYFLPVCLAGVPRRIARAPAVAAGNARCAHLGDVVELGRDQSEDGRASGHSATATWSRSRRRTERVRAAAVLSPGIAPDVVAMPVGQGHENFTRYRERPRREPARDSRAARGARNRRAGLGRDAREDRARRRTRAAKLILFAGGMSRFPHEEEPR